MAKFGQFSFPVKLDKYHISNYRLDLLHHKVIQKIKKQYPHHSLQLQKQLPHLPKTKQKQSNIRNEHIISTLNKNQKIILTSSLNFQPIYFKKFIQSQLTTHKYPKNCVQLSSDEIKALIHKIISNLFTQITLSITPYQNILSNTYYIYFNDNQTIPFSKCCNSPTFIKLQQNGRGKVLCNSPTCKHRILHQFQLNFDDGHKLWPHIPYFAIAKSKDKTLKQKISKVIITGQYKIKSLCDMVKNTSQQIVTLISNYKQPKNKQQLNNQLNTNMFLTGVSTQQQITKDQQQAQLKQLLIQNDRNLQTLKMKLKYMTKKQIDLQKKLSKSIIQQSKIFYSDFNVAKKIDQQIVKPRNSKTQIKVSFPQIIQQMEKKSKSKKHSYSSSYVS